MKIIAKASGGYLIQATKDEILTFFAIPRKSGDVAAPPWRNRMKACKDFRPMPTNKDVCERWGVPHMGAVRNKSTPQMKLIPKCRLDFVCPTNGQRPERPDQESDSEE